jgi:hypothetical protein
MDDGGDIEPQKNGDYDEDEVGFAEGSLPLIKKDAPTKRGVNALQLTMMIYFFTSGFFSGLVVVYFFQEALLELNLRLVQEVLY